MTFNEYYRSIQPVFLFFVALLPNRSFLSNTVYYLVFGNCVRWPVRLSSSQRGFFIVSRISQHPCLLSTFIVEKQAETQRDTLTCNNLVTRAICVFYRFLRFSPFWWISFIRRLLFFFRIINSERSWLQKKHRFTPCSQYRNFKLESLKSRPEKAKVALFRKRFKSWFPDLRRRRFSI